MFSKQDSTTRRSFDKEPFVVTLLVVVVIVVVVVVVAAVTCNRWHKNQPRWLLIPRKNSSVSFGFAGWHLHFLMTSFCHSSSVLTQWNRFVNFRTKFHENSLRLSLDATYGQIHVSTWQDENVSCCDLQLQDRKRINSLNTKVITLRTP